MNKKKRFPLESIALLAGGIFLMILDACKEYLWHWVFPSLAILYIIAVLALMVVVLRRKIKKKT